MYKLLWIAVLFTVTLFADFKVGDSFPDIFLSDQFGRSVKIESSDRFVLMAFEKEVAMGIHEFITTQPKEFMSQQHIKYISDVSAVPSFAFSMFALPNMKKYPFSVMLIKDDFGKHFEKREGKVSVYRLNNKKITAIQFMNPKVLGTLFSN